MWEFCREANASTAHAGNIRSWREGEYKSLLIYMFENPNGIAFCSSRCHLLQTSPGNFLALCPCWTCPPVPCRDPQGHRGGRKRHQGIPVRTSWSNNNEGKQFETDILEVVCCCFFSSKCCCYTCLRVLVVQSVSDFHSLSTWIKPEDHIFLKVKPKHFILSLYSLIQIQVMSSSLQDALRNGLVATEVLMWFYIGECIGKGGLIGYNV